MEYNFNFNYQFHNIMIAVCQIQVKIYHVNINVLQLVQNSLVMNLFSHWVRLSPLFGAELRFPNDFQGDFWR